jgi:hypothetical protein
MATYGSVEAVRRLLRPVVGAATNPDAEARIAAIRLAVGAYIEEKTGRTFGGGPAAATSVIVVAPVRYIYDEPVIYSTRLFLPAPIRTITEVAYEPEYDGTAWSGGTIIDPSEYVPSLVAMDGTALALESVAGDGWSGRYLVTGTWASEDEDDDIPSDLAYIADYLAAEVFKGEQTSAAAVAGADGAQLPMKNPYKNPLVVAILDKYRVGHAAQLAI